MGTPFKLDNQVQIENTEQKTQDVEVEYLPARSVDAKKIILKNERIMQIHEVPLIPIELGIENYYHWLCKEN